MRFYTKQHKFYCGIDLHTNKMYLCILNQDGDIVLHRNIRTEPGLFLRAIEPFREDFVVAAECMFAWYWLADLCEDNGIPFILGHALYMRAIHGGKSKNDKIDSHKIAALLKGGLIPMAYVYPREMRATRDLMRRRNHLMRKRAELFSHIQNTASQYNHQEPLGRIAKPENREGLLDRFDLPSVQMSVAANLDMIETYDKILAVLERDLVENAMIHDSGAYALLKTIPGVGRIIALNLLYEIQDISRFPPFRTSPPIAGSSNAPRNQTARNTAPPARRSPMPISVGLFQRQHSFSSRVMSLPGSTCKKPPISTARARHSPSWPISRGGPSTICSETGRGSI